MRSSAASPVWRHFLLLASLGALFVFSADLLTGAQSRSGGGWAAARSALRGVPDSLFLLLPIIAGVAVGTLRSDARQTNTAFRVTVATMLCMFVLQLSVLALGDPVSGLLASPVTFVRGVEASRVVLSSYPTDHPRVLMYDVASRAAQLLLLPAVLVGTVMGLGAWVRDRVMFRAPGDELVARWVLALMLSPLMLAVIVSWSGGYSYEIMFMGQSILLVLVPYLPAVAVAAVGWRRASLPIEAQAVASNGSQ